MLSTRKARSSKPLDGFSPVVSGVGVISRRLRSVWDALRRLTGDDAYERYLEACPDQPLGRRQFYAERVQRRWSKVSRCC